MAVPEPDEVFVHRIQLSKTDISALNDEERYLLVMLGHIANELMVLSRLHVFATHYDPSPSILRDAHASQLMMMARLSAGKLVEAWQFISQSILSRPVGKEYLPLLAKDGAIALQELKKFFGSGTYFHEIRDAFSFHYGNKTGLTTITKTFDRLDDSESLQIFLSESRSNTHYHISELVINYALLSEIDETPVLALTRLIEETGLLTNWIATFVEHFLIAIMQRRLSADFLQTHSTHESISGAPALNTVALPVFVSGALEEVEKAEGPPQRIERA